jgi:TRAP-type uncharacterized transport system substrate-binding protein
MSTPRRVRRILLKWGVPLAGVAALAFAVFLLVYTPRERSYKLKMTAGNTLGTRHELAQMLREEVASEGIDLEIRGSVGSEQALDWVNDRTLDLALVQGGLSVGDRPNVRQIATLHVEPLHLLVKKDLWKSVSTHLTALGGKTVNAGEAGSGTHTLSVSVLAFAGLRPRMGDTQSGYVPMPMSGKQMLAASDASRLPDAVFVVSSLPSGTVKELVARYEYRLVPLPFGEALSLEALNKQPGQVGTEEHQLDKARTYATTIPAFTYGVEPPVPEAPLPTLGNRLLLVGHKDVDRQAARRLIQAVYASEFARIVRPPLDTKLMEMRPEFPWHAGARLHLEHSQPLVSKDVMEYSQKAAAILAGVATGLFALWQWFQLRREAARFEEFKRYINQVSRIEEEARQLERNPARNVKPLLELQERLGGLKTEALDRFTDGELEGKELMVGFLAHIRDARDYLTELIAQMRENPSAVPSGMSHSAE